MTALVGNAYSATCFSSMLIPVTIDRRRKGADGGVVYSTPPRTGYRIYLLSSCYCCSLAFLSKGDLHYTVPPFDFLKVLSYNIAHNARKN